MLNQNFILFADSYKYSHWVQYPENTTNMFKYIESRGGKYDNVLFVGLQIFIQQLVQVRITQAMVDEAAEILEQHGEPFNREGWEYIVREYGGRIPLLIRAIPEGTLVPVHTMLVNIEATDPVLFWLPSWIETMLLRAVWYPVTVATNSFVIKQFIRYFRELTGSIEGLPFAFHDFGARGASSSETAGIGSAANLVNFLGTDTVNGITTIKQSYICDDMPGFSIPASEHSTMTCRGKEGEVEAFRNMLKQYGKPGKIFACVSDGFNIYNAVENIWGEELRQEIIDSGATLVVRPDSGDPVEVCTWIVKKLDEKFGSTMNEKGYKVLNHVRIIQGDGVTTQVIVDVLHAFKEEGYSADNIAFGQGGALLQTVNRDDQKFAMKCSAIEVDGVWVDVFKDPITDQGKRSKKGRLCTVKNVDGEVVTVREEDVDCFQIILDTVVYSCDKAHNGEIVVICPKQEWNDVKQRAERANKQSSDTKN